MKKATIVLAIFLAILFLKKCFCTTFRPIGAGTTHSILDSKKLGVFVCEYKPLHKNPYPVNDSLQIIIEESWAERSWSYAKHGIWLFDGVDSFFINIKTNANFNGYNFENHFQAMDDNGLGSTGPNLLQAQRSSLPDTITYFLVKGHNIVNPDIQNSSIGEFKLVKLK